MLFNSHEFIFVFLPVTLVLFYLLFSLKRPQLAWGWLTFASVGFYSYWNVKYLPLLLFSMGANLLLLGVFASPNWSRKQKKLYLFFGVALNLGLIAFFKYRAFLWNSLASISTGEYEHQEVYIPLAISFFTFQQIACLVEAYRGDKTLFNKSYYPLFISFFPQLIAGPIVLHSEFFPQLKNYKWKEILSDKLAVGLSVFFVGLFKKTVLADSLGVYADELFDFSYENLEPTKALLGSLAYTYQLYFDFSGYSDMAIGLAALFGIKIPQNFDSPYKAASIREFWKRWHITLSRFLKDYLYIALGGNRGGAVRTQWNLLVTMILGGLWHGANWTFVVWGAYHGALLILNRQFGWLLKFLPSEYLRLRVAQTTTFVAVVVGWIYFRSLSVNQANAIVRSIFFGDYDFTQVNLLLLVWIVLAFTISSFLPNTFQLFAKISRFELMKSGVSEPVTVPKAALLALAILVGIIGTVGIISIHIDSKFLYFQF